MFNDFNKSRMNEFLFICIHSRGQQISKHTMQLITVGGIAGSLKCRGCDMYRRGNDFLGGHIVKFLI